jgi:hypothetical protein
MVVNSSTETNPIMFHFKQIITKSDFSWLCPTSAQNFFRKNYFGAPPPPPPKCTILGVKKIFRTTNIFRNIAQTFEKSKNLQKNLLNFSQNWQNLSHFFLFQTKIARLLIEYCPTAQSNIARLPDRPPARYAYGLLYLIHTSFGGFYLDIQNHIVSWIPTSTRLHEVMFWLSIFGL